MLVLWHLALLEVTNEFVRKKHCLITQVSNISSQTIEGAFTFTKTGDKFSEDHFVCISKV
jgi:hypothetical protein